MIRTVEQYLEKINDGREIYCLGERVTDMRTHPTISTIIRFGAMDYAIPNDPRYRDLFVTKNEDGEDINFLLTAPKTVEDLLRRRECYLTGMRGGGVMLHCMGIDALAAITVAANKMDKALGTHYTANVEAYRKYLQKEDLGITGAITDVKGDRSLHPSKQVQHPDFYLRIVDRQKDGIIVRGAKIHISATPCADEAIIVPCRTHGEDDKDYALSFAVPLNTKGIKLLGVEPMMHAYGEEAKFDYPHADMIQPTECLIIFDDVFIPWERVFMCGEWQFSRDIVYAFATFHRLFGASKMVPELERLTGLVALIAEYNGVEKVGHIREKLAKMAYVTHTVEALGKMACINSKPEPASGIMIPDLMSINSAKYTFANNFHDMCKIAHDIGGGLATTVPTYKDWSNPTLQPYIDKYLGGKAGISTEDRIRAFRAIKNATHNFYQIDHVNGEGSLAAQQMFLYTSANWSQMKAAAKRMAHIDGWQNDPLYGPIPDFADIIPMPPIDESYQL